MYYWWMIVVLIVALLIYFWSSARRELVWFAVLLSPLAIIKPLIQSNFYLFTNVQGGIGVFLGERLVLTMAIGVCIAGLYERFLHVRFTPQHHPERSRLLVLLLIPVVHLLAVLAGVNLTLVTLISIAAGLLVTLSIRADLVWDFIFSSVSFGLIYVTLFSLFFRGWPGDVNHFWVSNGLSGITLASLPIEELILVFLYGALWGPIYVAIKDIHFQTTR